MNRYILYFAIVALLASCTAPRTVIHSGKVTPHKQVKIGGDYSGNIPAQTTKSLFGGIESGIDLLSQKDSIIYDEDLNDFSEAILSYALDPLGAGSDLYIRYGLLNGVDVGYKHASGFHVFDAMYQFKGSYGTIKNPSENLSFGSIGIQYSSKEYKLPDKFKLDKLQSLLGFDFKRKDILIPLIFSYSFGKEEEFGCISYGMAYNHTFIKYGFDSENIFYESVSNNQKIPMTAISFKKNYPSIGGFFNLKFGYRYIYLISSFSMFYQNYGEYELFFDQNKKLKGMTYIPSIGIQINPWFWALKKPKME